MNEKTIRFRALAIIGAGGIVTSLLFYLTVLSEQPPYVPQKEEEIFIVFYSIALTGTLLLTLCSFASRRLFYVLTVFETIVIAVIILSANLRGYTPILLVVPVLILLLVPHYYYYSKRFLCRD